MAGFCNGAYAKVWEISPVAGRDATDIRISISSKNQKTGEYQDDFGGYVRCYSAAHTKAEKLQPKDRIKLLETCVRSTYNKETRKSSYYFSVFNFEPAEPYTGGGTGGGTGGAYDGGYPFITEGDNPVESSKSSDALPY